MKLQYRELYRAESCGSHGSIGVQISVAVKTLPDLDSERIRVAGYKAADMIEDAVLREVIARNPETVEAIEANKSLVRIFPQPIYVEEIPNGYCSRGCCAHLPWFVVTTPFGRIKIGWRKRVISIDWSESKVVKTGSELFPDENTSKGDRDIHAWSLEKAKEYVDTIIRSQPN